MVNNKKQPIVPKWLISTAIAMVALVFVAYTRNEVLADVSVAVDLPQYETIDSSGLVALTNQVRKNQGISELKVNPYLVQAAQSKAQDMKNNQYFEHFRPGDNKSPWQFIEEAGFNWASAGENLARGFKTNNQIVEAWLASPTHRKNLLNVRYQEIGIATLIGSKDDKPVVLTVQLFGTQE